ncbi:hypothetical protein V2J09_012954 [Rumex salicifolius]
MVMEKLTSSQSKVFLEAFLLKISVVHNLDVMHIEKNVFENVFNTIMDGKKKTKDNLSSRKDLIFYFHHQELQVEDDHKGTMPKALYTLSREKRIQLLDWLRTLRFSDGYVSNIVQCVQLQEYKLLWMKSHDCHVFMQKLLPIAFKELPPSGIWGALTELSMFFQSICSSTLDKQRIEDLICDAPLILCQLERIFPPSFFDSMEHLIMYLVFEAKLGGPGNMLNPQKVEAFIVESYLFEEIIYYSQHSPEYEDPYKRSKTTRNEDNVSYTYHQVSIFNNPSYASGKCKILWMNEGKDFQVPHTYILLNCREVDSYLKEFQTQKDKETRMLLPIDLWIV